MIVQLKNQKEQEAFQKIGKITAKILKTLLQKVKPNITTQQLNQIAIQESEKHNVTPVFLNYHGFPAAICASVNNILVHGIPNNTPLKVGDIITIDFGAIQDGYIADTAETICVGEPTEKNVLLLHTCRQALAMGIFKARQGNKLSDISSAISQTCRDYKMPLIYGGHGISRNILHAEPFVPNIPCYEEDIHLRAGMIIAIEPMIIDGETYQTHTKGWNVMASGNTAHCEHTVLITEKDPVILTERK